MIRPRLACRRTAKPSYGGHGEPALATARALISGRTPQTQQESLSEPHYPAEVWSDSPRGHGSRTCDVLGIRGTPVVREVKTTVDLQSHLAIRTKAERLRNSRTTQPHLVEQYKQGCPRARLIYALFVRAAER